MTMPFDAENVRLTKLDENGMITGELLGFKAEVLWAEFFQDKLPDVRITNFGSMRRTFTVRYPRKWDYMHTDLHPDPLVVNNEYYFRPAGWYVVDVVGYAMPSPDRTIMRLMDPLQEALMSVTVVSEDQQYQPVLWARYHHPSLDYLREIARQIRTGERVTFIDGTEAIVSHTRVSLWTGGDLRPVETLYAEHLGEAVPQTLEDPP